MSVREPVPDCGASVLLIADDTFLAAALQRAFTSGGFRLCCENGMESGVRAALAGGHHLVLVDGGTRGADVLALIRQVRAGSAIPLIVRSPASPSGELIAMLESGADDVVGDHVRAEEVIARARAVLRRGSSQRGVPQDILAGRLRVVPAARVVRAGDQVIDLTSTEYSILEYLAREAGRVVPRDELLSAVCRRAPSPLDRALDVHVSHLRRKLRPYASQIVTVRGIGYMLAAARGDADGT